MPPKEVICPSCGCPMEQFTIKENITWGKKISSWICPYCHHEASLNSNLKPFERDYDQERAERYLEIGDWQEANDAFTKVLEKYTWSANAWVGKGIATIGLGLDALRVGDNTKAKQLFIKAEEYLATPRKTPCNFYTYKEYIALPCRLEFYQLLVSHFTSTNSTSISSEEINHLIKTLCEFCNFQPIVYYYNAWNQKLCSWLLPMGEFYYSLVKWIKPDIEDHFQYYPNIVTAYNNIIFLAKGSDPKIPDQNGKTHFLPSEALEDRFNRENNLSWVVNSKSHYYSDIATKPQIQLPWLVNNWLLSYLWFDDVFETQKPILIEQPDENIIILRIRIKIKTHEYIDENNWKECYSNYERDFTFCQEVGGRWVCQQGFPSRRESAKRSDEILMNDWKRLPNTSE